MTLDLFGCCFNYNILEMQKDTVSNHTSIIGQELGESWKDQYFPGQSQIHGHPSYKLPPIPSSLSKLLYLSMMHIIKA